MAKKSKFKLNKGAVTPIIKNFFRDNKIFLITFFGLYVVIAAISILIVCNYNAELSHINYYQSLLDGEYSYFKTTLKYVLFNLLFSFCASLTCRKKFAFALMYFVVTFIAYRLAVNIVGSWRYNIVINSLNAVLFYFIIYTLYVVTIVLIVSHINSNYLYSNDRCPVTLKKIFKFSAITTLATSLGIIVCTVVLPLVLSKILF